MIWKCYVLRIISAFLVKLYVERKNNRAFTIQKGLLILTAERYEIINIYSFNSKFSQISS